MLGRLLFGVAECVADTPCGSERNALTRSIREKRHQANEGAVALAHAELQRPIGSHGKRLGLFVSYAAQYHRQPGIRSFGPRRPQGADSDLLPLVLSLDKS